MLGKHYLCAVVTQEQHGKGLSSPTNVSANAEMTGASGNVDAQLFARDAEATTPNANAQDQRKTDLNTTSLTASSTPGQHKHGQAAPANHSTTGSLRELFKGRNMQEWSTATATMSCRSDAVQNSGRTIQPSEWAQKVGGKLNPRWVETLMGLPVGWTMPSCTEPNDQSIHMACDNRTDELRLLGNGVVPATAALAFETLLKEIL